jgi:hypothetical protein
VAKLVDFSFSVVYVANDANECMVGGTLAWRDPDWDYMSEWDLNRAKGADMYSLGLLLLWLLFHDAQEPFPDLQKLKSNKNDVIELAYRLVNSPEYPGTHTKLILTLIFLTCLGYDPNERASSLTRNSWAEALEEYFSEDELRTIRNLQDNVAKEQGG